MPENPRVSFLFRGQKPLAIFGGLYLTFIIALCTPYFQRHLLYLNALKWPLFVDFGVPEKYGFEPGKTIPLTLETPSGIHLGAWFTFAEPFYLTRARGQVSGRELYTEALLASPTILYFHGNAATRAVDFRVWLQRTYSTFLNCNVLAIDYRGFGNSTGVPTQAGLVEDAKTSWDWLVRHGAAPKDILIIGQSLGTGVSSQLGALLAHQGGQQPRAVVLIGAFPSVGKLLETYNLFGWIPLAGPLVTIPFAMDAVRYFVVDNWDTKSVIANIKAPLFLFHAKDDWDIPSTHASDLFESLLSTQLPKMDFTSGIHTQREISDRIAKRAAILSTEVIENVGTVHRFHRDGLPVTFVETYWGGHNRVAGYGCVLQILRQHLSL